MSTPETLEPNKEDLVAAETSHCDSLPPLENIQCEKEDRSDQVVYIAADDEELHLQNQVKSEVDSNLTAKDFREFLDLGEELDFFDAEEEMDDPGDLTLRPIWQ